MMRINLHIVTITLILLVMNAHIINCMDTTSLLPTQPELLEPIVAACDGAAKNRLALVCHALYAIASFNHKDPLIRNPLINLSTMEKHLLLLEYVEKDDEVMVRRLFELGATHDILSIFGIVCLDGNGVPRHYNPYCKLFPRNRCKNKQLTIFSTCIDGMNTLLHVAILGKKLAITKIILDNVLTTL